MVHGEGTWLKTYSAVFIISSVNLFRGLGNSVKHGRKKDMSLVLHDNLFHYC